MLWMGGAARSAHAHGHRRSGSSAVAPRPRCSPAGRPRRRHMKAAVLLVVSVLASASSALQAHPKPALSTRPGLLQLRGGASLKEETSLKGAPPFVKACATFSAMDSLLLGYDIGCISGILLFVQEEFALTSHQTEVFASAMNSAALFGALFSGYIADKVAGCPSLSPLHPSHRQPLSTRNPPLPVWAQAGALHLVLHLCGRLDPYGRRNQLRDARVQPVHPGLRRGRGPAHLAHVHLGGLAQAVARRSRHPLRGARRATRAAEPRASASAPHLCGIWVQVRA